MVFGNPCTGSYNNQNGKRAIFWKWTLTEKIANIDFFLVILPKKILSLLPNNQTILIFVWSFGPDAILYSFFTVWLKRIVRRVRFGT
jgi:hypothetical protein